MKISSFGYLLREGVRNIFANRLMSAASIGVLMSCLTLIGWSMLLSVNITGVIGHAQQQNEIVLFIEDGYDQDQLDDVENEIKKIEGIVNIEFQSKNEALNITEEILGDAKILLEGLDGANNPLPDGFNVKASEKSDMAEIVKILESIEGVIQVNAPIAAAQTLVSIKTMVNYGGFFIVIVLGAVSVMIIANTIKITVYSRRKEIGIMKYVGATDFFIRLPFIVEGSVIGLSAATLAYLVVWSSYTYATKWIVENPDMIFGLTTSTIVPFSEMASYIAIGFFGVGFIMGGFGSIIFVRKHLRV